VKAIWALLWLSLPALLSAQAPGSGREAPALVTSGAFFALFVPDLEASSRWYFEKLGLEIVMRVPRTDKAAVTVLEGGGLIVELIQHEDALPLSRAVPAAKDRLMIHGLFKAGVIVDEFDQALELLRARGVEFAMGPFPARPGQRANVIIKDNAGNLIQIFGK
jgi:catechol 2,3-dioxygenase-like lactoylglutathione lyase family enzyme